MLGYIKVKFLLCASFLYSYIHVCVLHTEKGNSNILEEIHVMLVISSTLYIKPNNYFFSSVQDKWKHTGPVERNTSAGSQSIRFFRVLAYWFFFFSPMMPSLKYFESEILERSSDEVAIAWQLCQPEGRKESNRTRSLRGRVGGAELSSADVENGWTNRRQADCEKASRLETAAGDIRHHVTFTSRRVWWDPRPISLKRVCAGIKEASYRCCASHCLTKHVFTRLGLVGKAIQREGGERGITCLIRWRWGVCTGVSTQDG